MDLSARQQTILASIRDFSRANGYPPTIRDIGAACGISSTSVVNYNLNILEREGLIERDRTVSRGIKLVGDGAKERVPGTIRVPVLGAIAAGLPIPVFGEGTAESAQEHLELTRDIVKDARGIYALRVKGDSMIDALVHDGDTVIVRQTDDVRNGDMVAAWLIHEEETTLKHFYQEGGRVRLQPANLAYQPIYTAPDNVRVQGKVVAVIRQLD
jgi:repressor LexA